MRKPASGKHAALLALLLLSACATTGKGTIAEMRGQRIEIKGEKIEDAREKAIESYRRFLEQTADSANTPLTLSVCRGLAITIISCSGRQDRFQEMNFFQRSSSALEAWER